MSGFAFPFARFQGSHEPKPFKIYLEDVIVI